MENGNSPVATSGSVLYQKTKVAIMLTIIVIARRMEGKNNFFVFIINYLSVKFYDFLAITFWIL